MKRIAFLLILLLSVSFVTFAQTQVATLQHGDDISVFYGATALIEAHDSAETGDIITLSSGNFASTTIRKAITLRGAGCERDSIAGILPTIIPSLLLFSIEDDSTAFLTVEGILFRGNVKCTCDLYNSKFIRCQFDSEFNNNSYNKIYNAQFINCFFPNRSWFTFTKSCTLINCVAWDLRVSGGIHLTIYNSTRWRN